MNEPLIVNFAPTGMVPTKAMTSFVPISVTEITEQTHEAYEVGITIAHLHARDDKEKPTYKSSIFRKIVENLRRHCPELVICLSMSGRNFNTFEKRSEVLELGIDMASLTLSSLNFNKQASVNDPEMIRALCEKLMATGTHPELEVFDLGMLNYANYLTRKKLLKPPFYFNIILGNIAGMQVKASHVGAALNELPENAYWSLGGIGQAQLRANVLALSLGGGVRVGLEDNLYYDASRQKKATNLELLQRIHRIAEEMERPLMTAKEFGDLGFYNKNRNG